MQPIEHINSLADDCYQETKKFRSNLKNNMNFCFELFRLAFEDKNNLAIAAIFRLYGDLVHSWVTKHPLYPNLNLPSHYYAADSMENFFFGMSKLSFGSFNSVASILSYWRKCVHTVIMQAQRKKDKQATEIDSDSDNREHGHYYDEVDHHLIASELWSRIAELLNEEDLLLARYAFSQELKPRQIVAEPKSKWSTTNEVRVALQRIKRQLQRDKKLKAMLGLDDEQ